MRVPRRYVDAFTESVNFLSADMRKRLGDALELVDMSDIAAARDAVIGIMTTFCGAYTDMAAVLGAEFYDGLREMALGSALGAVAESGWEPEAEDKAVRALIQGVVDGGTKEEFVDSLLDRADSEVRRSANESVARNARRDKAKVGYARVPSGIETCKWCIMIASKGPSFRSMEIASHSHANCDCRVVPDFGDGIQGYDPDYYYDVYKHPENHPEYREARNARRRELYDRKKMGAINGALNDDNDPYMVKRNAHAVRYYEEVRKRDKQSEIAIISRNSGIDGRLVAKAYDHLFVNEYDLGNGYSRFDESYDIAESWRRLREGSDIKAHDIILLQHESLEYDLMSSGMSYSDAHKIAEMEYNYANALREFLKGAE